MRLARTSLSLAALGLAGPAAIVAASSPAAAEVEYAYCLVPSLFTVGTCTYATYEQCAAAASGNIGSCTRNPRFAAPPSPRPVRGRG
jgi:hypothetical protein